MNVICRHNMSRVGLLLIPQLMVKFHNPPFLHNDVISSKLNGCEMHGIKYTLYNLLSRKFPVINNIFLANAVAMIVLSYMYICFDR